MSRSVKTIFIGTPDFGVPSLESLIKDAFFDIKLVISQPDKKIGRKQVLTAPPIKQVALKNNIKVLQPKNIIDILPEIKKIEPDIIIVIAYSQIIPETILNLPKFGCINVHGSLLPRYRGASCIQWPIILGDNETGITIMKMDKGLDTGPIISQYKTPITETDTATTIFDKLSLLGSKHLSNDLKKFIKNELVPFEQTSENVSYVKTLKKEDGKIDWTKSAKEIERFIRAMNPWPGAYSFADKLMFKILEVETDIIKINKHKPGTIFCDNKNLLIQCGDGAIEILKLQLAGKKPTDAQSFLRGNNGLLEKMLK